MKMWAGRFKKQIDSGVNDFNSSIAFDKVMYKEDIRGSIAHATMLGECGIIEKSEADKIVSALGEILKDIENGKVEFTADAEDIHMNIEAILTERIGDTGKRLHTARSRNDQVALDIRMYLIAETARVKASVLGLLEAIYKKACENTDTVMAGYTHLQRAQPVTFAHYILAYSEMLRRDYDRLCDTEKRMNVMPLGSGALASTTYPINRERVAELLGFPAVTRNSIDGVSDRDFAVELASTLSILMMHMSRFSEEIILWCSSEFGFIELDDAFSTGSSIMPQKKNPDVAELVRGKTGRVYGSLITLLTLMKGLPLAYNKDMQEDKEAIFDAIDNTVLSVNVFTSMFETMTVKADVMRRSAAKGFINATDCADYLVKKGLPFRDAYKAVGTLVARCIELDTTLEQLSMDEYKQICPVFDNDVYDAIDLDTCVNGRKVTGGPAKESVNKQLEILKSFLNEAK
ncbi:MAG: argininosuccinate lyase [Ruminococcaceae bacterium]|nr:argininosuccinate lyase [Oscillospiraceae bacterium]